MMEFEALLALCGGGVIAGVVLYNQWMYRKSGEKMNSVMPAAQEPWLDEDDELVVLQPPVLKAPRIHDHITLDERLDVIVPIAMGQSVFGGAALCALPPSFRVGNRAMAIEAQRETGEWVFPQDDEAYAAFRAGLPRASRAGAMNAIEYSEFVTKTRAFADAVEGEPQFPDMQPELLHAKALDELASANDVTCVLCIRSQSAAWSEDYVRTQAAALGFTLDRAMPEMHWQDIITLTFEFIHTSSAEEAFAARAITCVSLGFDVGRASIEIDAFAKLLNLTHQLAVAMEGQITDESGRPLQQADFEQIAQDVGYIQTALQDAGFVPGEPVTKRLLS